MATKNIKSKPNNDLQTKHFIIIILGFCLTYSMWYILYEMPLHMFLSRHITLCSEFTLNEQLSRFYLFIMLLISVLYYRVSNEPNKIKLSISFLLLSLILYMSECDIIADNAQPIFGLIIVPCTFLLLLRLRNWLSLTFFIVGFMLISLGLLSDIALKYESIGSLLPTFVCYLTEIIWEETFELIGITFLCFSLILCLRVPLWNCVARNTKGSLLMLFASGMISIGNGFMRNKASCITSLCSLAITIIGLLGLMLANKRIDKKDAILTLITKDLFYLFIFFFFVMLPIIHGDRNSWAEVILWFIFMFGMAKYMWRFHPVNYGGFKRMETFKS